MPPPPADQQTVEILAQRTDRSVLLCACCFAMGGAVMDLVSHAMSGFLHGYSVSMFWGMWIPFCFFAIPPIHYLARRLVALQARVAALEAALANSSTPSSR
jgi:hypothetical protein